MFVCFCSDCTSFDACILLRSPNKYSHTYNAKEWVKETLGMLLFLVVLLFPPLVRCLVDLINSSCSKLLEMVHWSSSYLSVWKSFKFKNRESCSFWKNIYTRRNNISFQGKKIWHWVHLHMTGNRPKSRHFTIMDQIKHDMNNYRLISVISSISIVMKVVHNKLYTFIYKMSVISSHHSFR